MDRVENAEDDLLVLFRKVGHVVTCDDLEQVKNRLCHIRVRQPVLLLQPDEHFKDDVERVREALVAVDPKDVERHIVTGENVPQDAERDTDIVHALLVVTVFTEHFRGVWECQEAVA